MKMGLMNLPTNVADLLRELANNVAPAKKSEDTYKGASVHTLVQAAFGMGLGEAVKRATANHKRLKNRAGTHMVTAQTFAKKIEGELAGYNRYAAVANEVLGSLQEFRAPDLEQETPLPMATATIAFQDGEIRPATEAIDDLAQIANLFVPDAEK